MHSTCKNGLKNEKHHLITLQNHVCRGGSISIPYINQPKVVPFCNNDSQQLKLGVHGSGEHLALVHLETDGKNTVNVRMNANFQTKHSAFIFPNTILLQMWNEDFKGCFIIRFLCVLFQLVQRSTSQTLIRWSPAFQGNICWVSGSMKWHPETASVTFPRWDAMCHCFCICFHFSACQFAGCRVYCLELRWSVCYMSGTYYLCCEANETETDRCHIFCGFCFCRSCGLSYFEPGNMAAQFQSK